MGWRFVTLISGGLQRLCRSCLALSGPDGALLLLGRLILMGNAFLISIFLVKKFGLQAVGTYTLANVAITFLSLVCGLGLTYTLPREALTNPQRNTVSLVWSAFLTPVSLLLVAAYAWVMAASPVEVLEISLFATAGFFFALTNLTNTLFLLESRTYLCLIFPVIHSIGLLAGVLLSATLLQFALLLLVFRALGGFLPFLLLNYARVGLGNIFKCGVRGLGYLPTDLLALSAEQSGPLILSQILTRADLGLFGLCRQVLTAGDMPGWAFVQSKYPQMVATRLGAAEEVGRQNARLSFLASLAVLTGSLVLGFLVFDLPNFFYLMVLLGLALPFRYNNCFYDQVIKAVGLVRLNTTLAGLKVLLAIPIFLSFGLVLGVWGAVIGLALLSVLSDFMYRKPARALYPEAALQSEPMREALGRGKLLWPFKASSSGWETL